MIRIDGDVARLPGVCGVGGVGERIPYGRSSAILTDRAFNLVGAGGASPYKPFRKSHDGGQVGTGLRGDES